MPFGDDGEVDAKRNTGGVNNTPRRIIEKKYLELSTAAIAELETQLLDGETPADRHKSATYILNKVADIYKSKDVKTIEGRKAKAQEAETKRKQEYKEDVIDNKKAPLKSVPVLSIKSRNKK